MSNPSTNNETAHVLACAHLLSWVQLFVTPWIVAHQAPQSMGSSQQEYWNLLSFPPPGDLPHPGTESKSLASPTVAGRFFTTVPPGKPQLPWCWWCLLVSLHIDLFIFQDSPFPFPFSCYLFNSNDHHEIRYIILILQLRNQERLRNINSFMISINSLSYEGLETGFHCGMFLIPSLQRRIYEEVLEESYSKNSLISSAQEKVLHSQDQPDTWLCPRGIKRRFCHRDSLCKWNWKIQETGENKIPRFNFLQIHLSLIF